MWLFTRSGFYSVTSRPGGGAGDLQVRARAKADLEALRKAHRLTQPIVETQGTDYPFRLYIDRERMAEIVAAEVEAIDYINFKSTIKDDLRHNVYLKVWGALLALMPPRPKVDWYIDESSRGGFSDGTERHPYPWLPKKAPGGFSQDELFDLGKKRKKKKRRGMMST